MQVYFTVNAGRQFWESSWCPLERGCPLKGFTVDEQKDRQADRQTERQIDRQTDL